jgi:hypothetical protein
LARRGVRSPNYPDLFETFATVSSSHLNCETPTS